MREFFKHFAYGIPPMGWIFVIASFSSSRFSSSWSMEILQRIFEIFYLSVSQATLIKINGLVRTGGHLFEYGTFALLVFWAFRAGRKKEWRWNWAIGSILIILPIAALDEIHQSTVSSRDGSIIQFGSDLLGTLGGLSILRIIHLKKRAKYLMKV